MATYICSGKDDEGQSKPIYISIFSRAKTTQHGYGHLNLITHATYLMLSSKKIII